ncbi:MAG TPA: hypothetical protein VIE65_00750 [Methylobacter sp.]|jgi:hypothetical protein
MRLTRDRAGAVPDHLEIPIKVVEVIPEAILLEEVETATEAEAEAEKVTVVITAEARVVAVAMIEDEIVIVAVMIGEIDQHNYL